MSTSRMMRPLVACALALGLLLAAGGQGQAACYGPNQQLPAQTVNDFVANPAALLAQYPSGGPQMISRIRDLAASNPAALPAIQSMIATASADQKTAIGTGLGQVARICIVSDQPYANQLQTAAAADPDVRVAYTAVAGDVAIGGVGGGAGGVGATTGTTGIGTNSGTVTGNGGGAPTNAFTYSSSVGGGGSASIPTTTTTAASPARSVSP